MLQLWRLDLADARLADVEAQAHDWLDVADRAVQGQRKGDAARRFRFGRWLMRRALAAHSGLPPQALAFALGPNGRPECRAVREQGLDFNLSHTGDRLVLAVGRAAAVGVDVEACGRGAQTLRVGRAFYPEAERRALAVLPEAQAEAAALRLWTVRESLVKAMGGTVWQGMSALGVDPAGGRIALHGMGVGAAGAKSWQAAAGSLDAGHCLALAIGIGAGGEAERLRHPVPVIDPLDGAACGTWMPERLWRSERR